MLAKSVAQTIAVIIFCTILNVEGAKKPKSVCVDGKHNFVEGRSDPRSPILEGFPVVIKYLRGNVYSSDHKPTCYQNRPTVLLPGISKLFSGEMTVPPNSYDLVKSGNMRMTIRNPNFDKPLCLNGSSQYLALPDMFCNLVLCDFIGRDLCEFLQKPGTHTIREMEQKLGFNSTLIIPEAPSVLGISLLDIFAGEFSFGFSIETEGKTILELDIPSNMQYIPIGMEDEDEEEEK